MEKETEREQEAARALMMERLREALATLTPRQASCLHAGFGRASPSRRLPGRGLYHIGCHCHSSQRHHQVTEYYIKRGWMEPPKEKAICTKTTPPKRNRKKTSAKKS